MRIELPKSINSDFPGYSFLIDFYNRTHHLEFDEVILDFSRTNWFDANLLAVLGAILTSVREEFNNIKIMNLRNPINILLKRNHFLSHFGGYTLEDYYETTIRYRKFKPGDDKQFKDYLDNELLRKDAMPDMSDGLRKEINKSILEVFNNAVIHAECEHIISCGQYFLNKQELNFTVVDMGITIKKSVNDFLGNPKTGIDAIHWAVEEGHTTRIGKIPGGLGLSLIRDFLKLNKGKMQIISGDGFWEQTKKCKIIGKDFPSEFPGTIVTFVFNVDQRGYYYLDSEKINEEDIF